MKAAIGFDWANWLYVNNRRVRRCSEAEIYHIGLKLGWYGPREGVEGSAIKVAHLRVLLGDIL